MKEQISENATNPEELEKLYRSDKQVFNTNFRELFADANTELLRFWDIRLKHEFPEAVKETVKGISETVMILLLSFVIWLAVRIPMEFFVDGAENVGKFYFNVLPYLLTGGLSVYILHVRNQLNVRTGLIVAAVTVVGSAYSYLYMDGIGDTRFLMMRYMLGGTRSFESVAITYFHLFILLWLAYGMAFSNYSLANWKNRFEYISYNADLAIISTIIHIGIVAVILITSALFSSIGAKNVIEFFMKNIATFMYVSSPFLATYLYRRYPVIGSKIAPALANILSVVVLVVLAVFLVVFPFAGKNPFEQREFLIMFNIVQVIAMAIIFFSLTGTLRQHSGKFNKMVLFYLAIATTIINVIAFVSISYRLAVYGFSEFKFTSTVGNLLFLINMGLIVSNMYKWIFKGESPEKLEKTIANYLLVYAVWAAIVVFVLPWIL